MTLYRECTVSRCLQVKDLSVKLLHNILYDARKGLLNLASDTAERQLKDMTIFFKISVHPRKKGDREYHH